MSSALPSRWPWAGAWLLLGALLLGLPASARAHTLGIDQAVLTELAEGSYSLEARVPPPLQAAIKAPILPGQCMLTGSPLGERGGYHVRFSFDCETPLTAEDRLLLPWDREGTMLTVRWRGAEPVTRLANRAGSRIPVELAAYRAGSGSLGAAAKRYTKLGIEHILVGADHLLFVLALLLIVPAGWRLVQTVTAFTVAHSITLGLATLGYLSLPPAPVEASIALSIVFLASEILHARQGRSGLTRRYPWVVAFAFGLLHGLGFAGALAEIGLPATEIPLALLFFNIGVELGQLLFIGTVMAALALLHQLVDRAHLSRLAPVTETLAVYAIGSVASLWFIERASKVLFPV